MFLVIATDPVRYRPLMPVAILEKVTFVAASFWLFTQGRLPNPVLFSALLDFAYGVGFVVAYFTTPHQNPT